VREQATPSWSDKICNEEVKKTDYIAESLLQLYLVEKGSVTVGSRGDVANGDDIGPRLFL
jgi:hypothetical protein